MCADAAFDQIGSRRVRAGRRHGAVVASMVAGRTIRSAVVWGAVFAVYLATSALGYASTYETAEQRGTLVRTFGSNAGVNAVVGPAHHIDTVAGFTAWRTLSILGVVGGMWGLLTATRLLRGEEEAGRWELLLAGRTTRQAATFQALLGLSAGLAALFAIPAAVMVAVGRSARVQFTVSAALFDVLVVISSAAVFVAVAALTSQLAPTRRRAAAYAAYVLGVAYALRMLADSGTTLEWLRWATPLGWIEEARPLTGSRPLALVPALLLVVALGSVSVWLAGARDLGASALPDRAVGASRTRLLNGGIGLTVRLVRSHFVAWAVGVGLGAVMTGYIAKTAGEAIAGVPGFQQALERLGAHGFGARLYLGAVFLIFSLLVALIAAQQLNGTREEESTGRVDHLLVRPLPRTTWLLGRLLVAVVALVVAGFVAGFFAWVGATSARSGIALGRLLEAGINVVPPAVVVLGAGTLAFGLRPRAVAAVTYGLVAWSFLIELIGSFVNASHWLLDTSVFHHRAAAPAADPNWWANVTLIAIGFGAALLGVVAFNRRDMVGE